MTIDINIGVIYIKICKIYSCKKYTYNINDILEIDMRESNFPGRKEKMKNGFIMI